MNQRLRLFIQYACGRPSVFADRMGWERQYLSKLTRGIGLGLTPVVAILQEFPELDARWLLLGEGEMLRPAVSECRPNLTAARDRVTRSLELARFLPFMSDAELSDFASGQLDFPASASARWREVEAALQSAKTDDSVGRL